MNLMEIKQKKRFYPYLKRIKDKDPLSVSIKDQDIN